MRSTHQHPISRTLHVVGLYYMHLDYMLVSHIMGQLDLYLASILAIWYTAIDLFMVGHVIEGNVGAMTLTILFKCVRFNSKVKA
jgi:hypothetical protein